MKRMCDAALVASLLVGTPALAGTPIANSGAMDTPVMNLGSIPVIEVTPTPGAGSAAADAQGAAADAGSPAGGLFEALIADFRWGDPQMGAVPHLPVPPPHKMRAEDGAAGGEDAPLDGNGGNTLPLHWLHLPVPALVEGNKLPSISPPGAPVPAPAAGSAQPLPQDEPTPAAPAVLDPRGAATPAAPSASSFSTADTAAPTVSDAEAAKLEQIMRELAAASADGARREPAPVPGPKVESHPLARNDISDAQRSAADVQRSISAARADSTRAEITAGQPVSAGQPASASATPPASASLSGLASSFERALVAANAAAPARDAPRSASPPGRPVAATSNGAGEIQTLAGQGTSIPTAVVFASADRAGTHGGQLSDSSSGGVLRDLVLAQPDTTDATQSFTLTTAALAPGAAPTAVGGARADAPVLQVQTPVQHPEWADGVGDRVVWLTQNDVNNAQIRLSPAHLGPVEVHVSIDKDQASVSFVAHHAATREALESASPRLREMLQSQGFAHVNVDVNQHSAGHRAAQEQRQPGWSPPAQEAAESHRYEPPRTTTRGRSVLDTFA